MDRPPYQLTCALLLLAGCIATACADDPAANEPLDGGSDDVSIVSDGAGDAHTERPDSTVDSERPPSPDRGLDLGAPPDARAVALWAG